MRFTTTVSLERVGLQGTGLEPTPNRKYLVDPCDQCMTIGAYRAALGVKDAATLFNAPLGCFFHIELVMSRHLRETVYSLQTRINEKDVIFGMREKLATSIRKALATLDPDESKVLLVISSCAAEITASTPQEGLVRRIVAEAGKPIEVISLPTAGIVGHHADGFSLALCGLIERFTRPQEEVRPRSVKLLGLIEDDIATRGDIAEIKRLLRAVDVEVDAVFCVDTSTADIATAPRAALNIVLQEEYGLKAAQLLEKRFGTPFICPPAPYGVEGTSEWLRAVASAFKAEDQVERLIRAEEARAYPRLVQAEQYVVGKRPAIIADPTLAVGLVSATAELGMEPALVAFRTGSALSAERLETVATKYCLTPKFASGNAIDFTALAEEIKPDVIFGSSLEYELSHKLGALNHLVSYPGTHALRIWDSTLMGYEGALQLAQRVGSGLLEKMLFEETVKKEYRLRAQ